MIVIMSSAAKEFSDKSASFILGQMLMHMWMILSSSFSLLSVDVLLLMIS